MSTFTRLTRWGAVGLSVGTVCLATSAALAADFKFSFQDTSEFSSGTVEGIITGLPESGTGPATSVEVTAVTSPAGIYGLGDYTSFATSNSFTVADGSITSALFFATGANYAGCSISAGCALFLDTSGATIEPGFDAGLDNGGPAPDIVSSLPPGTLTLTPISPPEPPTPTSVPYNSSPVLGFLAIAGLLGINHLRGKGWRKQAIEI